MDTNLSANYEKIASSGQLVLHDFTDIIGYESARMARPKYERFCEEFVKNGGIAGKAYQAAVNPNSTDLNAQKRASELLKKPEISGRIKELSSVIRNRTLNSLIDYRIKALNFDAGNYFDTSSGIRKQLHITDVAKEHRVGVGLEAKIVDGGVVYVPVFPSPEKSADALQKIMGLDKNLMELTGKNGKPIETESQVRFYIPDNGRD